MTGESYVRVGKKLFTRMSEADEMRETGKLIAAGHCRDCKWWEPCDSWASWLQPENRKECIWPDQPDTLFRTCGAENYESYLFTEPDFGCVQWEAK